MCNSIIIGMLMYARVNSNVKAVVNCNDKFSIMFPFCEVILCVV